MSDQIKNFFSIAFSILGIVSLAAGLYYLKDYGWDTSKYYFYAGGVFALISKFIEFTLAKNYDNNDF
jgi:hypothetical protein